MHTTLRSPHKLFILDTKASLNIYKQDIVMKAGTVLTILGIVGTITYLFSITKKKKVAVKKAPTNMVIIDLEKPIKPSQNPISVPFETIITPEPLEPYNKPGFGIDSHRNTDVYELDDYLNLPLVGEGKTYANSSLADVDESAVTVTTPSSKKYKYIRLHVLETRDDSPTVSLGHIIFYSGSYEIHDVNVWNPHTGITEPYKGSWTDSDMKTIIFCFKEPTQITKYIMKTSYKPPVHDPSSWILDGSKNASYWVPIHSVDEDLPVLRGKTMYFTIN